jgi:hypothetical protein
MKICIMQPYFVPYPGYYMLFKKVDLFVVFDDVQFNPRSFVHRNKIEVNKNISWFTLPIQKYKKPILINQLKFDKKSQQFKKFNNFVNELSKEKKLEFIINDLRNLNLEPLDYLIQLNKKITQKLKISKKMILSSEFKNSHLSGEKRIIDICKNLNAKKYINLPSGRRLYSEGDFLKENLQIEFLHEYVGKKISILNYLCNESFIL